MAYSINGKVYTDHALMDEIVYDTKLILNSIVLKNSTRADANETEDSLKQSQYYMAIKSGEMTLSLFPLTTELLIGYGYTALQAEVYIEDITKIPEADQAALLTYCETQFLANYVEMNNYYRMLNGLPEYGVTTYDVYVDKTDSRLAEDDANGDFNFSTPIHNYTTQEINILDSLGILADIITAHTGSHYEYLKHLGGKKIDIYDARTAANWDILYIPNVDYMVKSRFKELYKLNRDVYYAKTYQEAYKYQSDYYDEMLMIMILCQTLTDMIVDVPEWYIRRDIIDLRTAQYFLESQGVAFFKEIPLKYQVRIIKNLNKLIRYKSTTKNINDILELFGVEGTQVYKYYLFKQYLYTTHGKTIVVPSTWVMDDVYDFGDEEATEEVQTEGSDTVIYDFLDENESTFDETLELHTFEFGNEDSSEVSSGSKTDAELEYEESKKIIVDTYGNVYKLVFAKVPINDTYDNYIRNSLYRVQYDVVTEQDPYWDGEDVHSYIKNQILKQDFTVAGTKYMSLNYNVSLSKYMFQTSYFLGMIYSSKTNLNNIAIALPTIKANTYFNLTDIFILFYCLSGIYLNRDIVINTPAGRIKTTKKGDFYAYDDQNGGRPWNGTDPIQPVTPDDPTWKLTDLDFGDEDTDNIIRDVTTEMYDFGYQYDIDTSLPLHDFDYGEVVADSSEGNVTISPTDDGWLLGSLYDFGSEDSGYVEPDSNFAGLSTDASDYDFVDETLTDSPAVNVNTRYYDFLQEELNYTQEEIPTTPTEETHYWDNLEKGSFTNDFDGGIPNESDRYRRNVDGGDKRYSNVSHETFYDWMRWENPSLFIPMIARIYGFNLSADLDDIAKHIGVRHSEFGFAKGYTLADLGVDTFMTATDITSVEQLIKIYNTNSTCYNNLIKLIEDPESRDALVTYNYVFASLFTREFDFDFYRLKSGEIASTYTEILKEKNYTLYKYYVNLTLEKDAEARKDNVRGVLNDLVSTLQYYLAGDNLEYIFEFIPTSSFDSIVQYINLLIGFFKSWKVYFLAPSVAYDIDDKFDNKVGNGDMMAEVKTSYWYDDASNNRDTCWIKDVYSMVEENAGMDREVIDMYAYHVEGFDALEADGENVSSTVSVARFSNLLSATSEANQDMDGGVVTAAGGYVIADGGNVAARKEIYDIDGGGAMNRIDYIDVDGLVVGGEYDTFPTTLDFKIPINDMNGGYASSLNYKSKSISTSINHMVVSKSINISSYESNDIIATVDGLYLKDILANNGEFETFKATMAKERKAYTTELNEYYTTAEIYSSPEKMSSIIYGLFESKLLSSSESVKDIKWNVSKNYIRKYTDDGATSLLSWFLDLNPFGWKTF